MYPDGKVMFPSPIGEKAELYFDIDTTKSLCGGGALCFNLNVDGKGYWIGYPFRAGVEWDASQNKDMPVPTEIDLTDTSIMINADVIGNGDGVTAQDALVIQQVDAGIYKAAELPIK